MLNLEGCNLSITVKAYIAAHQILSNELGHNRLTIVDTYIGKTDII